MVSILQNIFYSYPSAPNIATMDSKKNKAKLAITPNNEKTMLW